MHATKEQIIKNYSNFHEDFYLTFPSATSTSLWKHIACHFVTWFYEECGGGCIKVLISRLCLWHWHTPAVKEMETEFQSWSHEVRSLITNAVGDLPSLQEQNGNWKRVFYAVYHKSNPNICKSFI